MTPRARSVTVMGRLIYSAIASLDGYIEDETGDFTWATPDHEVHAFVTTSSGRSGRISGPGPRRRRKARALPRGVRLDLDLLDERRFRGGTVFLRYAVRAS